MIDVSNNRPEAGLFNSPAGAQTIAVGTTGEFARIVGGGLDRGDLSALFGEVLEGDGVEGATLNTLDDDSFALELTTSGGVVDFLLIDNAAGTLAGIYHSRLSWTAARAAAFRSMRQAKATTCIPARVVCRRS
jgi:hypothetical protein